jgi:hypothetical protein
MPNTNRKKQSNMATPPLKRKSAVDELQDDFDTVIEKAASGMTKEEIERASQDFNKIVRRPASSKSGRRETA